jgi:hypothetical protein
MKLKEKKFWLFEAMMLICGILAAYVYTLNYGIHLYNSPGIVIGYSLNCLVGGMIAWIVCKRFGYWRMMGSVFLFATLMDCVFNIVLWLWVPNPYGSWLMSFIEALVLWCVSSILPIAVVVLIARRVVR